MKFEQSRFQDVFSRGYEFLVPAIIWAICSLIAFVLFSVVESLFLVLIVIFAWSVKTFFELRKYPNGSKTLVLDSEFFFKDKDVVTRFSWDDFQGFEITKRSPHKVVVKSKVYGKTVFGYYDFSVEQRAKILDILSEKLAQRVELM